MKLIFKQFFKTFWKNFLLIIGLSSLVGVLSYLLSTSINLTQSFNYSLNQLDSKGNKANVVSNVSNDFGYLDFSYELSNEPVKVYTSSLSIQKDDSGNITRAANTFFPYSKDELLSRSKSFGISQGVKVNKSATELKDMFSLDESVTKGIWDYNYGLSVGQPIQLSFDNKKALAYSFVSDEKGVLLNPKTILFNQYGLPFSIFSKGILSQEVLLTSTFDDYNQSIINAQPEIYDNEGYGITENFFNRSMKKIHSLHNVDPATNKLNISDYKTWSSNNLFVFDVFSKFIEKAEVNPYIFEINLDNSTGPIKTFFKSHPEIFEYVFDSLFYANKYDRSDVPGGYDEDVKSNISLIKKSNDKYQIMLAISDDCFIDYSSSLPIDEQIDMNKKLFLNNFKSYLSSQFNSISYELFNQSLNSDLKNQDIQIQLESEYYYRDAEKDLEYLYVSKDNNNANKVVVDSGSNLLKNDLIIKNKNLLSKRLPYNKLSRENFYALQDLIDLFPLENVDGYNKGLSSSISLNSNEYTWYQLLRYCLYNIVEILKKQDNDHISDKAYNSPHFKLFTKLASWSFSLKFSSNSLELNLSPKQEFTTLHISKRYITYIYENVMCVISNTYAIENKKKHLPTLIDEEVDNVWWAKLEEFANDAKGFEDWIESIKDTKYMELTFSQVNHYFANNQVFFEIWAKNLSDKFKISYKETFFIISGFGLSPDYAFPIVSSISPIPNPKKQVIVYLNSDTFNSLNISSVNIDSYYSFSSNSKSDNEIIEHISSISKKLIGYDFYNAKFIYDAKNMGTIYMRSYFPYQIRNLLVIFTVIGVSFLFILSIIIVYLILKSFIKNIVEPVSLCIANGIPLSRIIFACLTNFAIFLTPAILIGYVISYFTQSFFISLFNSIWLVPATTIVSFTPAIFIPLIIGILLIFGSMLSLVIYRKFKKPVPEVLSNKQDVKSNFFTRLMINTKVKMHSIVKLTLGFSSINLGRLGLITLLGSIALGGISSSIIIKDKFNVSQRLTNESRNYDFQYDFKNVNESSGLYKPQKFSEIGMENKEVGINSLYLAKAEWDTIASKDKYPYYYEQTQIKKIPRHGNESSLQLVQDKYLSNLIMPSYKIYQMISANNLYTFFNSAASIFLLDLEITFSGLVTLNIWDFIKTNFPDWLVNQLEQQAGNFQRKIMEKYGEWYYKFMILNEGVQSMGNEVNLQLKNLEKNNSGYYYATIKNGNKEYKTKPYYVWVDSDQWYWTNESEINSRYELKTGDTINLSYDVKNDFYNNGLVQDVSNFSSEIEWKFIPAYTKYHNLNKEKVSNATISTAWDDIRFTDEFLNFITTIYGDEDVSKEDSKISFGILPYDEQTDEFYTRVTGKISGIRDIFNNPIELSNPNIDILGIKNNSDFVILKDSDNKDINNLISSKTIQDKIPVIINEGASLEYNLKVGSTFELNVSNNALDNSYDLMNKIIGLNQNPIKTTYNFEVVGINEDSFGTKFYINRDIANQITSLDKMNVYTNMIDSSFNQNIVVKQPGELSENYIPFNGIFSKNPELLISYKSIPFYTYSSIWNTWTTTSSISYLDTSYVYNCLITYNPDLLNSISTYIKENIDNSFIIADNANDQRNNIINFLTNNFSQSTIIKSFDESDIIDLLSVSLDFALPSSITNDIFSMISNLTSSIIIIIVAILIPLLVFVTMVTSFSIVGDLTKNLALMKILGFSNKNIFITIALMYIPVFVLSVIIGLCIMLALNFGIQMLIYNLTTIFINENIVAWVFLLSVLVIGLILAAATMLTLIISRRKGLENTLKF